MPCILLLTNLFDMGMICTICFSSMVKLDITKEIGQHILCGLLEVKTMLKN